MKGEKRALKYMLLLGFKNVIRLLGTDFQKAKATKTLRGVKSEIVWEVLFVFRTAKVKKPKAIKSRLNYSFLIDP